jgi:hypothetical protein
MIEEKIKEVFADEEFVKKFFGKETPEEAQDLLAEKDIDVSIEELIAIKNIVDEKLKAAANGEDDEICDDDLENVAGGVLLTGTAFILIGVAVTAALGLWGAAVGLSAGRRRW